MMAPELLYATYTLAFPGLAYLIDVGQKRLGYKEWQADVACIALFGVLLNTWFYILGPRVYVFAYPIICIAGILPLIKLIAIKFNCLPTETLSHIRASFWNYYLFLLAPSDVDFNPKGVNIPALTKKRLYEGMQHLFGLLILNNAALMVHANQFSPLARGLCTAFQLALCFCAVGDLSLGLVGLLTNNTILLEDMFHYPYLAESPKDFWSNRWNLVAHKYICRLIYLPMGGKKRQWLSLPLIALTVGLIHELPMTFLPSARYGYWLAIFALHMAAVLVQNIFEKYFPNKKNDPAVQVVMRVGVLVLLSYTSDMSYKAFGMSVEQMASDFNSLISFPFWQLITA